MDDTETTNEFTLVRWVYYINIQEHGYCRDRGTISIAFAFCISWCVCVVYLSIGIMRQAPTCALPVLDLRLSSGRDLASRPDPIIQPPLVQMLDRAVSCEIPWTNPGRVRGLTFGGKRKWNVGSDHLSYG